MVTANWENTLTKAQFSQISELVCAASGIQLPSGKEELVKGRLSRRIRTLGLTGFDHYLKYLAEDSSGRELGIMIDAITTNVTSFFREPAHFDFLTNHVLTTTATPNRRLRIWSAGCSNGAEPYTMAITVHQALKNLDGWDIKILATDLSTSVLDEARAGLYPADAFKNLDQQLVRRYFTPEGTGEGPAFRVRDELKRLVTVAQLNLMEPWPMQSAFDIIFCRNVMIYFDRPTKAHLVDRFTQQLRPGGFLMVGHSESLAGTPPGLSYVQPATYQRLKDGGKPAGPSAR